MIERWFELFSQRTPFGSVTQPTKRVSAFAAQCFETVNLAMRIRSSRISIAYEHVLAEQFARFVAMSKQPSPKPWPMRGSRALTKSKSESDKILPDWKPIA